MTEGDLPRAKGSIYGTRDAGRTFWLHLRRILTDAGWKESCLEGAMFWFVEEGHVRGVMITHVDDLLYGFDPSCKAAKESITRITSMVMLKTDCTPFTILGSTSSRMKRAVLRSQ